MQHDHVLMLDFDLLTPPPDEGGGGGGGGGGRGVSGQFCYHVATFVIQFSLICNMTRF